MKKYLYIIIPSIISLFAVPVLAAPPTDFKSLVAFLINTFIRPLVPLLVGLAVVMFIYGVFLMVFYKEGEKREDGKDFMLWGIIGLFVMISVWGLVAILQGTFGLNENPKSIQMQLPKIEVKGLGNG